MTAVDPSLVDGIRVVHAGARCVVIEKPPGVLSVPGKGEEKQVCAAGWVRERFAGATGPLVVHRLDMDTSGLLVFGLDEGAQRELSRQFEARRVEKAYVALVEGCVREAAGVIDEPMRLDPARRPIQVLDRVHGREAVTEFAVMAYETDRTRLKLVPKTGRTHQLRVHCAAMGHAIVGDGLYGGPEGSRLMLHAAELVLDVPGEGVMKFESAVPF